MKRKLYVAVWGMSLLTACSAPKTGVFQKVELIIYPTSVPCNGITMLHAKMTVLYAKLQLQELTILKSNFVLLLSSRTLIRFCNFYKTAVIWVL